MIYLLHKRQDLYTIQETRSIYYTRNKIYILHKRQDSYTTQETRNYIWIKSLSVKPNLGTNTLNSVKMDIQSVINVIEYLNISNFVNKKRRRVNASEAGTINLYKARLLYLGPGEPPLKSLLIKDDMLEKGIFGPPRLILTYLPSIISL